MTSLSEQLKRLAVAQTSRLQPDKRRVSLLFSAEEAAKLDRETVFGIGINGFEELVQLDRRFADFGDFLFAEKNISFERSVETREVNDHLDRQLKLFLLRLSPYFQLKSSQKALEWLIYRYHIHEYNVSDVLRCSIPYYDTHLFARLLQILVIPDSDPLWFWLISAQKSGFSVSRLTVHTHANAADGNFSNFLFSTVAEMKSAGLELSACHVWFSFLTSLSTPYHPEMADLPVDVLKKIFGLLDMKTRVQMLGVNQRWFELMPFADRHGTLHIAKLPFKWPLDDDDDQNISAATVSSALEAILPQIGPRLNSVKFNCSCNLAAVHFDLIAQFCPDISGLYLEDASLEEPTELNFAAIQRMSKLKSLRLGDLCPGVYFERWAEADQARFLQNLSGLVGRLEEFLLANMPFPPAFEAPNLTKLNIGWCKRFTNEQLTAICANSSKLTSLSIHDLADLRNFTPIGQLLELTELSLTCSSVDEGHMEVIAQNCPQLITIDVVNIDDDSQTARLGWLQHLPNLRCLSINIDERKLADIPRKWAIEELEIHAGESGAILLGLSVKSRRLKRLRLRGGKLIDDVVVRLADRWKLLEELHFDLDVRISVESVFQLGQRESLRLLDLRWRGTFDVDILRLLVAKRQQLQVSTPLNIRLDCVNWRSREDFTPQSQQQINQLNEELRQVKVHLACRFR